MYKARLESILGPAGLFTEQPLSRYTSFKVGGPAQYLALPRNSTQVKGVISFCNKNAIPLYILGRGTNLLVSDRGLKGLVLVLGDNLGAVTVKEKSIHAQAGASLPRVSAVAQTHGLTGLEFAAGIPGSVGGATVMNAGAYGGEMKDAVVNALAVDAEGETRTFHAEELGFAYRTSAFQTNGHVVLEVELALQSAATADILSRMEDYNRRRREKQPLDQASAGSTFKRPEGHYAGQLIETCNLRGVAKGKAAVSSKHCGFIVNTGGATAQDIYDLIRLVQEKVFTQHGVSLVPEVKIWGEFDEPS